MNDPQRRAADLEIRPDYYGGKEDTYEVFKVIRAWWKDAQGPSVFFFGNVLKYLRRMGQKEGESDLEVLRKCITYLQNEYEARVYDRVVGQPAQHIQPLNDLPEGSLTRDNYPGFQPIARDKPGDYGWYVERVEERGIERLRPHCRCGWEGPLTWYGHESKDAAIDGALDPQSLAMTDKRERELLAAALYHLIVAHGFVPACMLNVKVTA